MMSGKKSPGRPRSRASHQAMLKATLELLAEVGFEAMSIEAIATRAEVGKTTGSPIFCRIEKNKVIPKSP